MKNLASSSGRALKTCFDFAGITIVCAIFIYAPELIHYLGNAQ
jgi:hypothetical protein